jgi:tetratricopeptide (TPR) repeat protein
MQNTEQAVQVRRESLRVLAHPPAATDNADFLAQLYASLAQHYSSIGEYEQAVENFQQALRLLQLQHSCPQLQEAYRNLLYFYTDKGLYSLAILYAYKGLLTDLRCHLGDKKNEIEYALGKVLLRHDPDKASLYLLERVKNAEARHDALALSGAYAQLARWQITRGDLNQATAWIALAQQYVTSFKGTLIHADIQLLAGELAYKQQDYDAGDRLFEDGLALLQQVGEREDLIEQFARYAQLLEGRNCIQKSIMYWKLAYESQQKNRMSTF